MTDLAALPYRPCVGIMLVNDAGHIFVAQRLDQMVEAWQMPQGGIDAGEDPLQAAKRELYEETSIKSVKIIGHYPDWLPYDLPVDLVPKIWGGRFRGQQQQWFLFRFDGAEDEINLQTPHPEFSCWRWAAPKDVPALAVPFKKQIYETVIGYFMPMLELA